MKRSKGVIIQCGGSGGSTLKRPGERAERHQEAMSLPATVPGIRASVP
jgi:hypothetical protein